MTLEDVDRLLSYWADHPPVHVLAAAYLGYKPREPRKSPEKLDDKWWETIEEKFASQELAGITDQLSGTLRVEE